MAQNAETSQQPGSQRGLQDQVDRITAEVGARMMGRDQRLLQDIGKLMDSKLQDFRKEVNERADESISEIRSHLKYREQRVFKKKGCEKQYKHNEQVLDCIEKATKEIDAKKLDKAKETLETGTKPIHER